LRTTKYIAIVLLLSCTIQASAQKNEDKWLKRNWNDMIARFNIYFNATQKLLIAEDNLASKQKDNFNEVMDLFPYGAEEDAKAIRPAMEETMKKASKVIQKKPLSKWVDDSYFIIGQTQFFSGDYFAARETFQFINANYPDPRIQAMSQLWVMKTYIQQEKYDDGEAIFGLLQKNKYDGKDFKTQLNLAAGDLMVKQDKYALAIKLLTKGLNNLRDRTLKYRTYFILGQLYLDGKEYAKANENFIKVLKLNAPYEYVFQANLGMAKSTAESGGQGSQKTAKFLKRMLDDDKNLEYFDQIYFELAKLEFNNNNEKLGLEYMKKSAVSASNNSEQQTRTYLFLADYFFGKRDYNKAQAYYDSTVAIIPAKFENADKIKAKHSILSKLIENIETIRTQDSLLDLSVLDRDVLDRKINEYIEIEAEQERLAKEAAEIQKEQDRLSTTNARGNPLNAPASAGGTFYFYNIAAVARGNNDFQRTWGKRPLSDFWRFINKSVMEDAISSDEKKTDEKPDADPDTYVSSQDEEQSKVLENIDDSKVKYYKDIPFSATAQLVAKRKIQAAYLGIGKVYFDDLKEYLKTKENLSTLLVKYPTTVHKPEALFYLSKSETELGNSDEAAKYAKQVADEFPESVYNGVLNAKEIQEDDSDKEVIKIYSDMYTAYTVGKYNEVMAFKKKIDQEYAGNSIQAKIDYLFALTIGKTQGKEAYIKELAILKEAYTGTEIGEMAAFTLRLLQVAEVEQLAPNTPSIYKVEESATYYQVITGITKDENKVQIQLDDYNLNLYSSKNLRSSSLVLGTRHMFYIKQFSTQKEALEYHNDLNSSLEFLKSVGLTDVKVYAISEANFKTLVKTKEENQYVAFFNNQIN
jgi:TolA-binding protein